MEENNFGSKITALRKSKNLTQAYVAKELGVTPAAVSKWENGSSKPRVEILFKLAELLDVNAKDLLLQNEETTQEQPRPTKPFIAVIVTLIFVCVVAVLSMLPPRVQEVSVPNLRGIDCVEAQLRLSDLGLKCQTVGEYHETIPQNNVISQNVKAGTMVKQNTEIVLTVSKGKQPISVPQVLGFPLVTAVEMLEKLGFEVDVKTDYYAKYDNGIVIYQSLTPGETVYRGAYIYILANEKP